MPMPQGNPRIVRHLQSVLARHGRSHITVLLSEVLLISHHFLRLTIFA